jgi:hypothetical protein
MESELFSIIQTQIWVAPTSQFSLQNLVRFQHKQILGSTRPPWLSLELTHFPHSGHISSDENVPNNIRDLISHSELISLNSICKYAQIPGRKFKAKGLHAWELLRNWIFCENNWKAANMETSMSRIYFNEKKSSKCLHERNFTEAGQHSFRYTLLLELGKLKYKFWV